MFELLVVTAILGILAAVVMPRVGRFVNHGSEEAQALEFDCVHIAVAATMADQEPPLSNLWDENDAHDTAAERTNDMSAGGLLATLDVSKFLQSATTSYYYWVEDDGTVHQESSPP